MRFNSHYHSIGSDAIARIGAADSRIHLKIFTDVNVGIADAQMRISDVLTAE